MMLVGRRKIGAAHVVLLEVQHEAEEALRSRRWPSDPTNSHQLAGHRAGEAVDARDAVADGEHGARLGDDRGFVDVLDLLLDDLRDLFGSELHRDVLLRGVA